VFVQSISVQSYNSSAALYFTKPLTDGRFVCHNSINLMLAHPSSFQCIHTLCSHPHCTIVSPQRVKVDRRWQGHGADGAGHAGWPLPRHAPGCLRMPVTSHGQTPADPRRRRRRISNNCFAVCAACSEATERRSADGMAASLTFVDESRCV